MGFLVRKRAEFAWDITDRRKASSLTVIKLRYNVRDRKFSGEAKRRYSKVSPWQKWKTASAEQLALARSALPPEEIARCILTSLENPDWTPSFKGDLKFELKGAKFYAHGAEFDVTDMNLPTL